MFDCISTVCLVLTSRDLVFVFIHSKLDRFECQLGLFLYLHHFISFTLNSYLLQIEYFLFCSHCIIQIITLSSKSSIIRKQFFSKWLSLSKIGYSFPKWLPFSQNGCPRLFSKLLCFKFNKGFRPAHICRRIQQKMMILDPAPVSYLGPIRHTSQAGSNINCDSAVQ